MDSTRSPHTRRLGRAKHGRRRAVSEIVATLIMIAVVASLGVLAFTFASSGLGSLSQSFASLMGGVNLGLRYVGGSKTPDIYAPVLGAAGYLLELRMFDGRTWKDTSKMLWGTKEEFLLGGPDSASAQARFSAGLVQNLYSSVEALLKTYRDGQ